MILQIDDWKFDIDMERTMAYSAAEAAEHCDCAYCRNFYAVVDVECPDLRSFLARFGLDIEAPDSLYPYDIHDRLCYEGEYLVFGRILQSGKHRINIGGACNPYIYPMVDSRCQFEHPCFILSLEELELSWILEEPLKDVVSPANEPSFLKRMWDRLLGKAKKTEIQ